jgi:ATP-dependent Lon protease
MTEQLDTKILPLLPLTTGVVLPHMVVTLTLESPEARAAVEAARQADDTLLLVPRQDGRYARVGTVAKIEDVGRTPSGVEALVIRGLHRAIIGSGIAGAGDATWVQVEPQPDPEDVSERTLELAREYRAIVETIVEARGVPQVSEFLRGITEPGALADTAGYSPDLSFDQKVEVLETLDVQRRLEKVVQWTKDTLAELAVKDKIREEVTEGMQKNQREYILRQQLEAIKKELGESDDATSIVEEYRTKIAEANMPEGARKEAEHELGRLERTSEQSPEYGWIRTYLDWMVEIPWDVRTEDNLDITVARQILDEDHTGLEDVKDRIIEYLAVRKLRADRGLALATGRGSGAILTLVGPPGVG